MNFYIIEDDISVQNILKRIIINNNFGDVLGMATDGLSAEKELVKLEPEIVLVDLLLPGKDGISIVSSVKETHPQMQFIMISEVRSSDMISKAYQEGIEFYINKPINVIEVVSVIQRVREKIEMSKVIHSFETAFSSMKKYRSESVSVESAEGGHREIEKLFLQLGISGDKGAADILAIIDSLETVEKKGKNISAYRMTDLYNALVEKYEQESGKSVNRSTIEQRVRRTVFHALENLCNLGIEDYGNDVFSKHSSALFDFKEVRVHMDFIRGKSYDKGSINVRKFIDGIMVIAKQNSIIR